MPNHTNPYVAGLQVGGSAAFIGREDIVKEILRVLRNQAHNAIVLYGQRRIGKTSLLHQLRHRLPGEGPYCPIYFDLQDRGALTLAEVLVLLAQTIARDLSLPNPNLGADPETAFKNEWLPQTIHSLVENGQSLVLLFDEFDVLADPQSEQASSSFFPYLRQLMELDTEHLQFVFVIGRNMTELRSDALSVFKGTQARAVSLLSPRDTEHLIRLSEHNQTLLWTSAAVQYVIELTNGHPYLTQSLCSQVWENAHDNSPAREEADTDAVQAAISETLTGSRNTLEWLWGGLSPAQRIVAAALAHAGPGHVTQDQLNQILTESGVRIVIRELHDAPRLLQDWDILEESSGGFHFRVELLRQWITSNKPLSRVQDELDRIQPLADSLFSSGRGYYQLGNLVEAETFLTRALGVNPNHQRANELLIEIYLANQQFDKAEAQLERLVEYAPQIARPRLVQVWLSKAALLDEKDEEARLVFYKKVLEFDPKNSEAKTRAEMIVNIREQRLLDEKLSAIFQLEEMHQFEQARNEAVELSKVTAQRFDWKPVLDRLNRKVTIPQKYERALVNLRWEKRNEAINLLREIVFMEPRYKDATFLLYLATSKISESEMKFELDTLDPLSQKISQLRRGEKNAPQPEAAQPQPTAKLQPLYHPPAKDSIPNPTPQTAVAERYKPRQLTAWLPFDPLIMFIWVFFVPSQINQYKRAYGDDSLRPIAGWLYNSMLWAPLAIPFLALWQGTLSTPDAIRSTNAYYYLLAVIATWVGSALIFANTWESVWGFILNMIAIVVVGYGLVDQLPSTFLLVLLIVPIMIIMTVATSVAAYVAPKQEEGPVTTEIAAMLFLAGWVSHTVGSPSGSFMVRLFSLQNNTLGQIIIGVTYVLAYGLGFLLTAYAAYYTFFAAQVLAGTHTEYTGTLAGRVKTETKSVWTCLVWAVNVTVIYLLCFQQAWLANYLPTFISWLQA